jgi:hypothetical protein
MGAVKRGYDAHGYTADADLAAPLITQLARAGLKARGLMCLGWGEGVPVRVTRHATGGNVA